MTKEKVVGKGEKADNTVIVTAGILGRAVEIGAKTGPASDGCVWSIYVDDDFVAPMYKSGFNVWTDKTPITRAKDTPLGPGWRLFSATGRWFRAKDCDDRTRNGLYPEGDSVSTADLIGMAIDAADPPTPPAFGTSPESNGSDLFPVVNIPTWFWIDEPYRSQVHTGRAEFPAVNPRVWAEAEAVPVQVQVNPGDGSGWQDACDGLGIIRRRGTAERRADCTYTYTRTTAGKPGNAHQAQGRIWFTTSWTTNAPGIIGETEDPIFRDATPQSIQVGEIQAVSS